MFRRPSEHPASAASSELSSQPTDATSNTSTGRSWPTASSTTRRRRRSGTFTPPPWRLNASWLIPPVC